MGEGLPSAGTSEAGWLPGNVTTLLMLPPRAVRSPGQGMCKTSAWPPCRRRPPPPRRHLPFLKCRDELERGHNPGSGCRPVAEKWVPLLVQRGAPPRCLVVGVVELGVIVLHWGPPIDGSRVFDGEHLEALDS